MRIVRVTSKTDSVNIGFIKHKCPSVGQGSNVDICFESGHLTTHGSPRTMVEETMNTNCYEFRTVCWICYIGYGIITEWDNYLDKIVLVDKLKFSIRARPDTSFPSCILELDLLLDIAQDLSNILNNSYHSFAVRRQHKNIQHRKASSIALHLILFCTDRS